MPDKDNIQWSIDYFIKDQDKKRIIRNAFSSESLSKNYQLLTATEKEQLRKEYNINNADDFIRLFSSFIYEQLRPKDRQILSPPLMSKIDTLHKISYRNEIEDFKRKCEDTDEELIRIVCKTLESLWIKKYEKEEAFARFSIYKNFEKILFKDPKYRDHFIHQFQVFLCGLPILEAFYDQIYGSYRRVIKNSTNIDIEFSWLLAATFHDIGYLMQQFDTWLNTFFKEFLSIRELPINLDLARLLVERNFQEYIDKLTSLYGAIYYGLKEWEYDGPHKIDNKMRKCLTRNLIDERNHGIISSVILLDQIEFGRAAQTIADYKARYFSPIIMPACLAIALHDKEVFLRLNQEVDFKKDPLTFLLIYCDLIQEWGRPISPLAKLSAKPRMSEFIINSSEVSITLTYDKIEEITIDGVRKTNFELKQEEIKEVLDKLKSVNPVFKVILKSEDDSNRIDTIIYKSKR
jgi:hypothetical protein